MVHIKSNRAVSTTRTISTIQNPKEIYHAFYTIRCSSPSPPPPPWDLPAASLPNPAPRVNWSSVSTPTLPLASTAPTSAAAPAAASNSSPATPAPNFPGFTFKAHPQRAAAFTACDSLHICLSGRRRPFDLFSSPPKVLQHIPKRRQFTLRGGPVGDPPRADFKGPVGRTADRAFDLGAGQESGEQSKTANPKG